VPAADNLDERRIAYFSMEIALEPEIPTYSGGLGILAGDTLRACADLRIPTVGVSLALRRGYFKQALDEEGRQRELPDEWAPERKTKPETARVTVEIEGRTVQIRAWRYEVRGATGYRVPVLLLDTDLPENAEYDRRITDSLYGGNAWYRLAQEVVLGVGGRRVLRALGYGGLRKLHLNEGHAAFAAWDLLKSYPVDEHIAFGHARRTCVFTTHTPVPAGHDQFPIELVRRMFGGSERYDLLQMLGGRDSINMTRLALNLSGFANGVAIKHQEVTEGMFPGYAIHHVTNGVHSRTWTSESFQQIFDRHIPGWQQDPSLLRHVMEIDSEALWTAHKTAKARLIEYVSTRVGASLAPERFTIGFARRAAAYKRADLIFADMARLRRIARDVGPLQLVFAGKAHPQDEVGKQIIQRIFAFARELGRDIPIVYLPDYGMEAARVLVAGVDLWLNTPEPPLEASGTSGMKAAHNGVPTMSTLDGWWVEGHVEGVTGWSITDAAELYTKLEQVVLSTFRRPEAWAAIMKHCIALNASFFNTHRMVQQYAANAYLPS
jgi:starch phosphorylase